MARRQGWLSGGALPPLPSALGAPEVTRPGPSPPTVPGDPDGDPRRLPPPVAIQAQPVPRHDGRREGFLARIEAVEMRRQAWRVAGAPRGHPGPQLASVLGHALLLAGVLVFWGGVTVVPAPPQDPTIGLQFAEDTPPPAPVPPTPAVVEAPSPPAPPVEAPTPPPPIEAPAPPPAEISPPLPLPPAPPEVPAVTQLPPPRPTVKRPAPARPAPHRPPAPTAAAPAAPAQPAAPAPAAPASVAAPARLLGEMSSSCPGVYPPAALRRGLQGRVLVRAQVAADGTPGEVAVATSSGFAQLDRAAVAAVQGCRHLPRAATAYVADIPYVFTVTN